jgi:D-alanyl-D-alanine carboxypeptidase
MANLRRTAVRNTVRTGVPQAVARADANFFDPRGVLVRKAREVSLGERTLSTKHPSLPALLFLLPLLCATVTGCSEKEDSGPSHQPLTARLQTALEKLHEERDGIGISVSVVLPDGDLWTGVAGVSHDEIPMTPATLFGIGSVTKMFTATLVLALAEQGALSLDDQLQQWLPGHPNIDGAITIRQLLNHTSGVAGFFNNEAIWNDFPKDKERAWTTEEVLTYVPERYFAPGTSQHYVNTNYILLGMIIREATGSRVSAEFRRRLWSPLGLTEFFLGVEDALPDNVAHGYSDIYNKKFGLQHSGTIEDVSSYPRTAHDSIVWTAGGLYATPRALAAWAHALFNGRILNQDSLGQMLEFVQIPDSSERYGLGVFAYPRSYSEGEESIGHTGMNAGHMTQILHLPRQDVTIVVSMNNENGELFFETKDRMTRMILEEID